MKNLVGRNNYETPPIGRQNETVNHIGIFLRRLMMKNKMKLVFALIVGLIFALVLMWVLIYLGYSEAYRLNVEAYDVAILGLPIFALTKMGTEYAGQSIGKNMGLVCGICMVASVFFLKLIQKIKNKRNPARRLKP